MAETKITAVMIDDEERARDTLRTLLRDYCPQVEVLAESANVPDGVLAINKHQPKLVFLDIEMPEYNGFELLSFFREIDFEIIFSKLGEVCRKYEDIKQDLIFEAEVFYTNSENLEIADNADLSIISWLNTEFSLVFVSKKRATYQNLLILHIY